ncbi:hypothetical protein TNIN_418901 [Trichonephila inaurata madagascariensis]|uniref:Uncharacterized protein n=1 Tax=Trichonephila inaurata madagascariensis TaxID=2747483 RepID=A0A8X7C571_9ARAC|nr:hypothetical protein TNIN_418901 [Trichonephila inaurata madagascariensis]
MRLEESRKALKFYYYGKIILLTELKPSPLKTFWYKPMLLSFPGREQSIFGLACSDCASDWTNLFRIAGVWVWVGQEEEMLSWMEKFCCLFESI